MNLSKFEKNSDFDKFDEMINQTNDFVPQFEIRLFFSPQMTEAYNVNNHLILYSNLMSKLHCISLNTQFDKLFSLSFHTIICFDKTFRICQTVTIRG